jgi:hypothetical protein
MFVAKSHASGFTLAHQLWAQRHWLPINPDGYRDDPFPRGKEKKVMIIGDSFTAGDGIENYRHTFGNRLEDLIKPQYDVINLGQRGADSQKELINFTNIKIIPDIIFLQYYGNDIESAAERAGIRRHGMSKADRLVHKWLLRPSFFLEYMVANVQLKANRNPRRFFRQAYQSEAALNHHFSDLNQLIRFCKQYNIKLAVVLFPFLSKMEDSSIYLPTMQQYFKEQGVPTINLYHLLQQLPEHERIVHAKNHHPSEKAHAITAQTIHRFMQQQKWLVTN